MNMVDLATVSVVPYGGFGEEIQVMSDDLLHRLVAVQAPEAVRAYGATAGSEDKDVMYLRIDFQCDFAVSGCAYTSQQS